MSRQNLLNYAFGIEEVEQLGTIEDIELAASQAESENGQLMEEFDTCTKAMNTLVHDKQTLDNMYGIVEKGVEAEEGVDSATSAVVNEAVENICRRYGFKRNIRRFNVANESFNSRQGKMAAANNLKVSIESVFDKIKEWVKKIWEWIKKQWNKLFNNNEKRLDTIKDMIGYINDALGNLKDQDVKKVVINNPFKNTEGATRNVGYSEAADGLYAQAEQIESNYKEFCGVLDSLIEAKTLRNLKPLKDPREVFDTHDIGAITVNGLNDFKKGINRQASLHDALKAMLGDYSRDVHERIEKLEELFGTIDDVEPDEEGNKPKQAATGWWAKLKNTNVGDLLGGRGLTDPRKVLESIRNMSNELTAQTNGIISTCFSSVKDAMTELKSKGL